MAFVLLPKNTLRSARRSHAQRSFSSIKQATRAAIISTCLKVAEPHHFPRRLDPLLSKVPYSSTSRSIDIDRERGNKTETPPAMLKMVVVVVSQRSRMQRRIKLEMWSRCRGYKWPCPVVNMHQTSLFLPFPEKALSSLRTPIQVGGIPNMSKNNRKAVRTVTGPRLRHLRNQASRSALE